MTSVRDVLGGAAIAVVLALSIALTLTVAENIWPPVPLQTVSGLGRQATPAP